MKTRILHTKFWKDGFVASLAPEEKLVFNYYLTSEKVNILHLYECPDREVLFDTGVTQKTLERVKEKLQAAGKVYFFKDFIYIKNADRYENYTGDTYKKAKSEILKQCGDEITAWYNQLIEGTYQLLNNQSESDEEVVDDQSTTSPRLDIIHNTKIISNKPKEGDVKGKQQKPSENISYLQDIPKDDLEEFAKDFKVTKQQASDKGKSVYDSLISRGLTKKYKDYKSLMSNIFSKDFGRRTDEEKQSRQTIPLTQLV